MRAAGRLATIPVSVTLPREEWLFLETILITQEIRAERKARNKRNRKLFELVARRLNAIKFSIINAERSAVRTAEL